MGGDAEGADEVSDVFACLFVLQLLGCGAYDLENDLGGAFFFVGSRDG